MCPVHPELRAQRGEAQPLKLEEATTLLPDAASALLEYVVTDEVTYLFVVTKAQGKSGVEAQVFTLPVKQAELAKLTESFRGRLAGRDLGFRASAHHLYDLLLKPAQALLCGKSSLVIGQATIERAALAQRGAKLARLPEAEEEVSALGRLYGATHSKVYIGAEAREDRVKAEAGQARILHFATHGTLNSYGCSGK